MLLFGMRLSLTRLLELVHPGESYLTAELLKNFCRVHHYTFCNIYTRWASLVSGLFLPAIIQVKKKNNNWKVISLIFLTKYSKDEGVQKREGISLGVQNEQVHKMKVGCLKVCFKKNPQKPKYQLNT